VILRLIFIVDCSYHHTMLPRHTVDARKRKARSKKDNKERQKERQKEVSFRRSRRGKI